MRYVIEVGSIVLCQFYEESFKQKQDNTCIESKKKKGLFKAIFIVC